MYSEYAEPALINCLLVDNAATVTGGGMTSYGWDPVLLNCTLSGNSAGTYGGGVFLGYSSPVIVNCVLWGDTPEEIYVYSGSPLVTYSDVQGGSGEPWFGTGCIDANPLFMDAGGGDYRIGPGSPCIDAGDTDAVPPDVATDLAGRPRVADGDGNEVAVVDMGAYERGLPGDWDRDGSVDIDDWLEFPGCMSGPWDGAAWVMPSAECRGVFDFDGDADVDLKDFAEFQVLFGGERR